MPGQFTSFVSARGSAHFESSRLNYFKEGISLATDGRQTFGRTRAAAAPRAGQIAQERRYMPIRSADRAAGAAVSHASPTYALACDRRGLRLTLTNSATTVMMRC